MARALNSSKTSGPNWNLGRRPHVCVVGAGVAGLRCADVLLTAGIEVTIYEYSNEIGGRVKQGLLNGHLIDLGANWIHGTVKNPILDIARETGTVLGRLGEVVACYNEYGCEMDRAEANEMQDLVWGIISEAFQYSRNVKDISPNQSLKEFFIIQLQKRDLDNEQKQIIMYMAEQWRHFVGLPLDSQSLKNFWLEEGPEGENLFVADTYKAILNKIAQKAKDEAHLWLEADVTTVGTVINSSPPRTQVWHRPGIVAEFDGVVIAVSLNALRASTWFNIRPAVPERLEKALGNLHTGSLEKAYITFPSPFWHRDDDPSPPSIYQFLHPLYDPLNEQHDIVECVDLSRLPQGTAQPTLLFYFLHTFILPTPKQQDYRHITREQRAIERFQPYFALLPNYNPWEPDCRPQAVYVTDWLVDSVNMGSYTCFYKGEDPTIALDEDLKIIREGLPERRVYFAGEYTAPIVALGTVTGAYLSGEAAAHRVINDFSEVAETS